MTSRQQQIGRIGGLMSVAKQGSAVVAGRARAGFLARFEREARAAHPDASEAEVAVAAELLKRAHFARLSLASSQKRAQKQRTERQERPVLQGGSDGDHSIDASQ